MWGVWANRGVHSLPALVAYGDAEGTTHVDPRERAHEQAQQKRRSTPGPARSGRAVNIDEAWAAFSARWNDRRHGRGDSDANRQAEGPQT